ncbi:MAG: exo-alpha-sialidase [Opitutaceae bacterium]|nr:exo-alpha-sialidase [Opitutaceae bacterium]
MRLPFWLVLIPFAAAGLRADLVLHPEARALGFSHQGPFVRSADGAIWAMDAVGAVVSRDEGRTWSTRTLLDGTRFRSHHERALLRTREGVILYAFLNAPEKVFRWDNAKGGPQEGCRLPVYVQRSADDGTTWGEPRLIQEGWCGAVRQMIQLRSGRIVLVSQRAEANPGRHVTLIHVSDDLGQTWQTSVPIDLREAGNYSGTVAGLPGATHGGGIEGTVFEKENGELTLLLRVPHGHFEQLTSRDGLKWSNPQPSPIEASDSPGAVLRLASGRLALVWNRYTDPVARTGRREELSLAFSANDGLTWTVPQVIAIQRKSAGARESASWIAYPYLFEATPGRLWITTMQGAVRMALNESDLLSPGATPLDGPAVRILTLGDSITRAARPGVSPTESYAAQTQAALRAEGIRAAVHSVGIGGERTDGALKRLQADVLSQHPDIVTVMYGTNDSWVDPGRTESRLSEGQYAGNLRELVGQLQAAGIRVVLMTPPRFGEENRRNGLDEEPNLRLGRYVRHVRALAAELNLPLVDHFDAWEKEQVAGRTLQAWTTDGCHPNREGHAALTRQLMRVLPAVAVSLRR